MATNAASIHTIFHGQAFGDVATKLLAGGFKTHTLRTNGVLLKDEWKVIDPNG